MSRRTQKNLLEKPASARRDIEESQREAGETSQRGNPDLQGATRIVVTTNTGEINKAEWQHRRAMSAAHHTMRISRSYGSIDRHRPPRMSSTHVEWRKSGTTVDHRSQGFFLDKVISAEL